MVDDLSIFLQRIDKTCGNNKFFVIQALKHKNGNYNLFTRWGVMGTSGQQKLQVCDNLSKVTSEYAKKKSEKNNLKKGYFPITKDLGSKVLIEQASNDGKSAKAKTKAEEKTS